MGANRLSRPRALEAGGVLLAAALAAAAAFALLQASAKSPPPPAGGSMRAAGSGADVAWLTTGDGPQTALIGIDPSGQVVGKITAPITGRNTDGTRLYGVSPGVVEVYSAATGRRMQRIDRQAAADGPSALSPDGRYLAALRQRKVYALELIDLEAGRSVSYQDVGVPGQWGGWLQFGADGRHIYVFTPLGQQTTLSVLAWDGSHLQLEARVTDGKDGHRIPRCDSPPTRLVAGGRTAVSYCPSTRRVAWLDLDQLTVTSELEVSHRSPHFWLVPLFAPDGSLLALHEPSTGALQVVDLRRHAIVARATVRAHASSLLRRLAGWLLPTAEAKVAMQSLAISPDGRFLYVASGGVSVFSIPELVPKGHWVPEVKSTAIWASPDGHPIYVLDEANRLSILSADGTVLKATSVDGRAFGFVASMGQ